MVKLPRLPKPPVSGRPKLALLSSVRCQIIIGFGLLIFILGAVVAASAWLEREHRSDLARMEHTAVTANLLEDAQLNATLANLLLERYITTENDAAAPTIRASMASVVDNLAKAQTREEDIGDHERVAAIDEVAAGATVLQDASEQVISLLQSGDMEGARQALEAAVPEITRFGIALGQVVERERQEVQSLRSQADAAGSLAFWLLVVSGALGGGVGLAAAVIIGRSILKPLSYLESAALAVAGGDLKARAPATGPRELARLGASINQMTESLLDASKRRELEEALRKSEQSYRELVENANDIVYSHDLEGHFMSISGACERILGYTREEALKMNIAQVVAPEHLEQAREMVRRKVSGEGSTTYELHVITKDGRRVPLEVSTRLIFQDGKPVGVQGIARDITERKRAEEALRQSEERFRKIFEEGPLGMAVVGPDYRIVKANQALCQILGYAEQELSALTFPEITHPDDIDVDMQLAQQMFRGEIPTFQIQKRYIRKDGKVVWANLTASMVRDERGNPLYCLGMIEDITERKLAEEALRESEERYRQAVENSPNPIFTVNKKGVIQTWNRACEKVFQYGQSMVGQKYYKLLYHAEDRPTVEGMLAQAFEGRSLTEVDITFKARSGEERLLVSRLYPLLNDQGDVEGCVFASTDITERRRAEEALRESEERFRKIVETAYDAFISIHSDGRIIAWNAQAEALFGWSREEALGRELADTIVPAQLQELHQQGLQRFLATGEGSMLNKRVEVTARRRDGREFPAELVVWVVRSGDSCTFNAFVRDITERKRAEEALKRLNDQLEKEQREIEALNRSLEQRVQERTEELRLANEELRERNRQLLDARAQAATDGLTGLCNHRAFQERVRQEVSRVQANGGHVSLIMMDIDGFKGVNDSLGHQTGDGILRELAAVLTDVVDGEHTYRYGGDEFVVLLPGTDRRNALRIAHRLRREVTKRTDRNGTKVTISLGVASLPEMAESADELIYGADAAMYWAKSAGKNRVGDWGELLKHRADGAAPWFAADHAVKAPDVVAALMGALAAKDPITSAHTKRCSWYAARLSEELGLKQEETSIVRLASLLHDVGKLAVPDEILCKPGPLSEEEWAQMKQHPTDALNVLGQIRSIADATPAIVHHHEHFDGSGYPDGLAGEDIPVASRILLVTDAFDAMTTDRPYRKAMPIEAAVEELKRNSGTQFDPMIVEAFLQILDRHGAQPLHETRAGSMQTAASVARRGQNGDKASGR